MRTNVSLYLFFLLGVYSAQQALSSEEFPQGAICNRQRKQNSKETKDFRKHARDRTMGNRQGNGRTGYVSAQS